jgi:hypothetical protein
VSRAEQDMLSLLLIVLFYGLVGCRLTLQPQPWKLDTVQRPFNCNEGYVANQDVGN